MARATATILLSCPDQTGLVARLAQFVFVHGGNIIHADHHTDATTRLFLTRIEWELEGFDLAREQIAPSFAALAGPLGAVWELHFADPVPRVALCAGKQEHCLVDLLWRHRSGELRAEIPLVVSNHPHLGPLVQGFGIEFHCIPTPEGHTAEVEACWAELLEAHGIQLVILAKYMRVLSAGFLERFPRVINIHHSFLPAFAGAQPYHQAYARGVKIIGATAHYVTPELDQGPIIEQDVARVSHRDDVADLVLKGQDLERVVLARAVRAHLQHRVLIYGRRTVVFA